jgi:hypothetical protein
MTPHIAEHNDVTLALGKIEQEEHLEEMAPAIAAMKDRPLIVKAYAMDDPSAPSLQETNVKCVHFVRHGQGFHNLMADLAKQQGRVWKNVSCQPHLSMTMHKCSHDVLLFSARWRLSCRYGA